MCSGYLAMKAHIFSDQSIRTTPQVEGYAKCSCYAWNMHGMLFKTIFVVIMRPAQPSEAMLGGVHFIFSHIQNGTRLLQGELFKVTMYTARISSKGCHFLTARVLVYWTYKVSKLGYGQTNWMVSMYSKYTAHIISSGSHFLTDWFLMY